MPEYQVRSNREAGDGRPDITLYPINPKDPAYIFELKIRKKFNEMQGGLQEAYDQIHDKRDTRRVYWKMDMQVLSLLE